MSKDFGRSLTHLCQDVSVVENALQAVEDLFGKEWLQKTDCHRLQILWSRKDFLSTSELYSLGVAVLNLRKDNSTWLESTAREIKKNIDTSHGLITEIVLIGSLSVGTGSHIKPCSKSYPIYDYTIEKGGKVQWKVSIKNFDISNREREFQKNSDIIRIGFKNFLKHYGISGSLKVEIGEPSLSLELATKICVAISTVLKKHSVYSFPEHNFSLSYEALPFFEPKTIDLPSDIVWVFSPQHYNEQRNIESKIDDVNKNMLKDNSASVAFRHLILRIGASTDLNRVKAYLDKIAENPNNCGFDLCILWQPNVTGEINSYKKMISHTIMFTGKNSFSHEQVDLIQNLTIPQLKFPTGCILNEPAKLVMIDPDGATQVPISGAYVYQKGDVYLKMEKQKDNSYHSALNTRFPGVRVNAVIPSKFHRHKGKEMFVQCLIDPEHEQLLIL